MMPPQPRSRPIAVGLAVLILGACNTPTEPGSEAPPEVVPRDVTPPVVSITSPANDDLIVDREITIAVTASDSAGVTKVELLVDGAPYDADLSAPWEFTWNNDGMAEGNPVLTVTAYDAAGNTATTQVAVLLRDLVFVTEIEVTNESDGILDPNLEIEVHLYDADDGTYLGCAGEHSGLEGVNVSDVRYPTQAYFQTLLPEGELILLDDVEHRNLKIEVIEDDLLACPDGVPGGLDDLIGTFEPLPVKELTRVLSFDDVVHLALGSGRRG